MIIHSCHSAEADEGQNCSDLSQKDRKYQVDSQFRIWTWILSNLVNEKNPTVGIGRTGVIQTKKKPCWVSFLMFSLPVKEEYLPVQRVQWTGLGDCRRIVFDPIQRCIWWPRLWRWKNAERCEGDVMRVPLPCPANTQTLIFNTSTTPPFQPDVTPPSTPSTPLKGHRLLEMFLTIHLSRKCDFSKTTRGREDEGS